MTSMSKLSMTLAEFEQLLDVYGADRTRWPVEARAGAAQLVTRDVAARRLLAEAEALDRVLQNAPAAAPAAEAALAERIVAAALRSPRMVKLPPSSEAAASAEPIRAAALPSTGAARPAAGRSSAGRVRLLSREAGAVGFLAASLVIGVLIGHTNLPPQILPALAEIAGLSSDGDELVQIALSDEVAQ
jgi:hypothetical protein